MRDRFYLPGMKKYVNMMINNCSICLNKWQSNIADHKDKDPTFTPRWSYFGQCVYFDTVGPLSPKCKYRGQSVEHCLTMLDGFSRFLVAIPIRDTKTPTIVKAFVDEFVFRFGCPQQIHSDNGAAFTSEIFQALLKQLGIYHTLTPPYNPQSNRVERAHLTLFRLVRVDKAFADENWAAKIPLAVFLYNTIVNRNTGYSPFETVYGRTPNLPIDILWPICKERNNKKFIEEVENLRKRWQDILVDISTRQDDYLLALKNNLNKFSGYLKEGDFVYYFMNHLKSNISKKIRGMYVGPFKVVKVISDSVVIIYPEGTWATNAKRISVNVAKVRKIDPDLDLSTIQKDKFDLKDLNFDNEFEEDILLTTKMPHICTRNCRTCSTNRKSDEINAVVQPA